MVKVIPDQVLEVYKALEENKFEAYFVGGSVRDLLLKRKIKDWDLTTNATPEQIVKVFPNGFYDNEFGTVGVPVKIGEEDHVVEITTYRTEESFLGKNFGRGFRQERFYCQRHRTSNR